MGSEKGEQDDTCEEGIGVEAANGNKGAAEEDCGKSRSGVSNHLMTPQPCLTAFPRLGFPTLCWPRAARIRCGASRERAPEAEAG